MLTYTCYNIQFYFYILIQPLTNMHMYIDNYSAYWGGGGGGVIYLFVCLFVCLNGTKFGGHLLYEHTKNRTHDYKKLNGLKNTSLQNE